MHPLLIKLYDALEAYFQKHRAALAEVETEIRFFEREQGDDFTSGGVNAFYYHQSLIAHRDACAGRVERAIAIAASTTALQNQSHAR